MAKLLRGAEVAAAISEKLKDKSEELRANGIIPKLAIVRVGENSSDMSYERGALKRGALVNVETEVVALPETVSQEEVLQVIEKLNQDKEVHGVLIFRPLPKHINDEAIRNALAAEKDVDGITDLSLSGIFTGSEVGFPPCTAQACIEILDYYNIEISGKNAVVLGRSLVIGKPVSMLLMKRNGTISVCHTKTSDEMRSRLCQIADIVVVATGKRNSFTADLATSRQTIIDVGINIDEDGKLCGDVDFANVEPIVEAITPVPGGVGAVTTAVLMKHVINAAMKQVID